ncbi:Rad52/22 family double-strand break repair protein-domain-containing protein [Pelagophyceae sp. CCMP2097]|nr:Rad52/22 family double-strand break repair protein-domain-containing protein [Pelagophyceae sp. CCMP2097]|mmetsp:Transcript_29430/g.99147  ORF Transcript_29430/g.99147 Transcript_29430/m.99147 type:complete len:275 (+) Transcript_29430:41-865(+)
MLTTYEPQAGGKPAYMSTIASDVDGHQLESPGADEAASSRREYEAREASIQAQLDAGVAADHLATRKGPGGQKLTYVEGHVVLESMNRIFGHKGWSSQIVDLTVDYAEEDSKKKWTMGVTAMVRITLSDGGSFHEDVGFGSSQGPDRGLCIANAKKSAVTDATKRAMRCFGEALGNTVYSKDKVNDAKEKAKENAVDQRRSAVPRPAPRPPVLPPARPLGGGAPQPPRAAQAQQRAAQAPPPPEPDQFFDGVDMSNFMDDEFADNQADPKRPCT